MVLEDEFDPAGVVGDGCGTEGTGRPEAVTAVGDGDRRPVPAARGEGFSYNVTAQILILVLS